MGDVRLSDEAILSAVSEVIRRCEDQDGGLWTIGASRWDVAAVLSGHRDDVGGPPIDYANLPERQLLETLGVMVERGLIDGCACGCRGDFIVLESTPV